MRLPVAARNVSARRGSWDQGRPMTGADQFIARRPAVVAWLAKVYAEITTDTREWPAFDARNLGTFLKRAGVNVEAAVKANEDALPVPVEVGQLEPCIDNLRGGSFLARPVEGACQLIKQRIERSERR